MFFGDKGRITLSGKELQELFSLGSNLFEIRVNRPVPDTIQLSIENSFGMEIGRKDMPIKVLEDRIQFKAFMRDVHFVSGEKGEKVSF